MTKIPKFENARFLGAGSFALVYAAEVSGNTYAVKLHNYGLGHFAEKEFSILELLKEIKEVPQAYELFEGEFSLKELGFPFSP